MNIIWHGQSFFEISVKNELNEEVKIAIDPYGEDLGLKAPKVEAQLLLVTHQHSDHSNIQAVHPVKSREAGTAEPLFNRVKGEPFIIDGPGEYEVKGVFVQGIPAFHDDKKGQEQGQVIVYTVEAENMRLCHLADLGQKELTPEQLEEIGEVDILMIPTGSKHSLLAKDAAEIISQIEPKIVIPMHYKIPGLKKEMEEGVDKFLKVMGVEGLEPQKKLKISQKDLPKEETEIVVLEP
jgi:L-ascorbate metabolism protein UlaG (beta-lactamase superfamily)